MFIVNLFLCNFLIYDVNTITYIHTFVSENGNFHLVWGTPSMIERIKEYEKLQENGQYVYIKYINLGSNAILVFNFIWP